MKLRGVFVALGVWPIVHVTHAQATAGGGRPSAIGAGTPRFAEENICDAGVAAVRAIAPEEEKVGEDLIKRLEANGYTTGETPCTTARRCRACKWGMQLTRTNGGSIWHRIKSKALRQDVGIYMYSQP